MPPRKANARRAAAQDGTKKQQPEELETADNSIGPRNMALMRTPFKNERYKTPKKPKNLKQILALEKTQDLALHIPTYQNIECPPSVKPQKKYCDITGLAANYTDPKTGLRYHNSELYQFVRTLGVPNVQAYLKSRNAAAVLK